MTSDVGALLVLYLRLFNSRCAQLILGAGARRSAGLKDITSKHLVLVLQALAFVATLIGYIREFIRRHAGSGAAASSLVEFDKVKRLYEEHQNSIYVKIVEIMRRLAALHVKTIKHIDWDNDQKIVVFQKRLFEVDPKTESGRESMLRDIEFFESNLGKLDGCGDTAEYLTTVIKSKQAKTGRPANLAAARLEKKDTEDTADAAETRDNSEDAIEDAEKADDKIAAKASGPETK
ncbi:vacuolar sorting protein [Metarhizium guizhouense ARSEF 977]|uniref:Vacuolar sorting protein n=1 Tax=Metarhizium guizhouense (strain ARSEF 977) TaxID=1276136 RepID=A0A0B4HR55_METGA|nr:vacuolar sorting protein [Metarhizium guizhouense ARSEF 977]